MSTPDKNHDSGDVPETEFGKKETLLDIPEPLLIDAIRCRLRQDAEWCQGNGIAFVALPPDEAFLISDILEAARQCVREWDPSASDKSRGYGTGVGMRAAEDRLIMRMKAQ